MTNIRWIILVFINFVAIATRAKTNGDCQLKKRNRR